MSDQNRKKCSIELRKIILILINICSQLQNYILKCSEFLQLVFDAQPKPLNGIFELSGIPLANYDQCLSIESPDESGQPKIRGQYCPMSTSQYSLYDPNPKPEDYPHWAFDKFKERNYGRKISEQLITNLVKTGDSRTHDDWLSVIAFIESVSLSSRSPSGLCFPTTCNVTELSDVINRSE